MCIRDRIYSDRDARITGNFPVHAAVVIAAYENRLEEDVWLGEGKGWSTASLGLAHRYLHNRVSRQLQGDGPILKRAGWVVSIAAHIQSEIKSFADAGILDVITAPYA